MATVSKWAIFIRVFLITFLMGQASRTGAADETDRAAWEAANSMGTVAAYYAYLSRYPAGAYADDAVAKLVNLGAMKSTKATRDLPALKKGGGGKSVQKSAPAAAAPAAQSRTLEAPY